MLPFIWQDYGVGKERELKLTALAIFYSNVDDCCQRRKHNYTIYTVLKVPQHLFRSDRNKTVEIEWLSDSRVLQGNEQPVKGQV